MARNSESLKEHVMTPIASHITAFFHERLTEQRGASEHTYDSYTCTFCLLFNYASQELKVSPSNLWLEQIDAPLVEKFLQYLEDQRDNAPSTRNVRLAAIKSFFRFLEYRQPAALDQIRRVLAIPFKKTVSGLVHYLQMEEVQSILDAPDPSTRLGIRDRALLYVALCGGLRASEIVGLRKDDLTLAPPSIFVRGKGRRERSLPLWKEAATTLRAWLAIRGDRSVPELFVNSRGQQMSRWGVAYILKKHVTTASQVCPSLLKKQVSPHVIRHTSAMFTLQATQDIRKVALWLGHSDPATTEVYTRTDPSEKLEAIEAIIPPNLRKGRFRPPDKLLDLLRPKP
jgi:site-specific recombinase XerD